AKPVALLGAGPAGATREQPVCSTSRTTSGLLDYTGPCQAQRVGNWLKLSTRGVKRPKGTDEPHAVPAGSGVASAAGSGAVSVGSSAFTICSCLTTTRSTPRCEARMNPLSLTTCPTPCAARNSSALGPNVTSGTRCCLNSVAPSCPRTARPL